MNQLQHETSPYLLQHAHNPVDWYAWKPEAFERARQENKPILVSIGYSTCHWCHVMERESFEDETVANYMNEHFINIKVDREERPDVDQIYMEACQAMTGGGGWPLNCFLLPDGRPFYAGTYYPPQPAYNRPSWPQVLQSLHNAFHHKRETLEKQADQLTTMISNSDRIFISELVDNPNRAPQFTVELLRNIFNNLRKNFDRTAGGFGSAPKFPGTMSLDFLLQYHYLTGESEALQHVYLSLDKMIRGGIYDQLGGGFARYATDRAWLIPHFEKMLYDNALLIKLIAEAYQYDPKPLYKETIEETLEFIRREMTSPEGGFYSALDADSEGVEGKYYVWDRAEVEEILGEDADLFCNFYDVTEAGNWEEKNILWRESSFEAFAKAQHLPENVLKKQLTANRAALFRAREKRVRPGLDDKILLSWNALQCTAYVSGFAALGKETYKTAAVKNMQFLLEKFSVAGEKHLLHSYKAGKAQYLAFLDDYAYLIEALIELYQITYEERYIDKAAELTQFLLDQFLDKDTNLFYFTSADQKDILLRRKELYDNATPSGNSVMAGNLQRLGIMMGNEEWRRLSVKMLESLREAVAKYPSSFSRWAQEMLYQAYPLYEIAIVGEAATSLATEARRHYFPNTVLMAAGQAVEKYPLLRDRGKAGDTYIYVCKDYACQLPVKSVSEMQQLIKA